MYSYIQTLTDEQKCILQLINNNENYNTLQEQINFIGKEMKIPLNKIANKLLHLHDYGLIINEQRLRENRLGFCMSCDGYIISQTDELMILTPSGLGYLETNNILEQIIKKASEETNASQSIINKIWHEVKDVGIDFVVKLTKEYINNSK